MVVIGEEMASVVFSLTRYCGDAFGLYSLYRTVRTFTSTDSVLQLYWRDGRFHQTKESSFR